MIKELLEYADKSKDSIEVAEAVKIVVSSIVEMSERSNTFNAVKRKLTVNEYDQLMSTLLSSLTITLLVNAATSDDELKQIGDILNLDIVTLKSFACKKYSQA